MFIIKIKLLSFKVKKSAETAQLVHMIKHFGCKLFYLSILCRDIAIACMTILRINMLLMIGILFPINMIGMFPCNELFLLKARVIHVSFFVILLFILSFLLELLGHSFIVQLIFILQSVFRILSYWGIKLFWFHGNDVELTILFVIDVVLIKREGGAAVSWEIGGVVPNTLWVSFIHKSKYLLISCGCLANHVEGSCWLCRGNYFAQVSSFCSGICFVRHCRMICFDCMRHNC